MKEGLAGGILAVALTNVNFSVVLFFPKMQAHFGDFKALDDIARWVVFPFYRSVEFVPILLGVRDFVQNSLVLMNLLHFLDGREARWHLRAGDPHQFIVGDPIAVFATGLLVPRTVLVARRSASLRVQTCLRVRGSTSSAGECAPGAQRGDIED